MQVYDARETAMHWQRHKHGRAHADAWGATHSRRRRDRHRTRAHLCRDGAAAADPRRVRVRRAAARQARRAGAAPRRVDLLVPAEAEFVLEGYVDNDDLRVEGPFGDHTGVYSLADRYPTFHVTCITHRRDPIYAATVVGKPPMEDAWLGKATERIFLPLLQTMLPEVVDMNLPVEGGFHNLAIVSIRKSYPGQAKKVMNALWGLGHMMMLTRCSSSSTPTSTCRTRAVAWFALNNFAPERDVVDDAGSGRRPRPRFVQRRLGTRSASTRRARTRRKATRASGRRDGHGRGDARARQRALARVRPRYDRARAACRRLVGPRARRLRRAHAERTAAVKLVALFLREIRIEHTLFALPFAYVGAVFAARGVPSLPRSAGSRSPSSARARPQWRQTASSIGRSTHAIRAPRGARSPAGARAGGDAVGDARGPRAAARGRAGSSIRSASS